MSTPPAQNNRRASRRGAAIAAAAGTLGFTGALLAAGLGAGTASADALCDQMRAQYGPSWPCISVPTYTPPPTMPTQPTTPNAPGAPSGSGPVIGGDAGPGPGQGNGTPIVGGTETPRRPNNTRAPGMPTTQAPGTTTLSPTPGQRERPGRPNVEERPDQTRPPADTPVGDPVPGTATDNALLNPSTDDEPTIPLPVWAIAGAAAIAAASPRARTALRQNAAASLSAMGRQEVAAGAPPSAFDIAVRYIYLEMMHNLTDPNVPKMRRQLESGDRIDQAGAFYMWRDLVKTGSVWDHKPKIEDLLNLDETGNYYIDVPGTDYAVYYDIFSNIHYGYIGRAAGFTREALIKGANVQEQATGVNDIGDDMSMTLGMDLYDRYGASLTYDQFYSSVMQLVNDMAAAKGQGQNVPQIKGKSQ